jgi:hypothetical protein
LYKSVHQRRCHGLVSIEHPQLANDVGEVEVCSSLSNTQFHPNVSTGHAMRSELQTANFTR